MNIDAKFFNKTLATRIQQHNQKVHTPKSIHRNHFHFYILAMKKSEKTIKESIPFTNATKRIKYLGINLTKDKKELYTEN